MSYEKLSGEIQRQLTALAADAGKQGDRDFLELMAGVWQRKESLFELHARQSGLEICDVLPAGDSRGFMALSYSGSLLAVGPDNDDTAGKWLEYSAIKLRTDVPDIIADQMISLPGEVRCGHPIVFINSRISTTSPVYRLAVCPEDLEKDQQDRLIREGSIYVTTGFMKFNRDLSEGQENIPDQFTMKSMTRYLAKKHGLTGNQARLIVDDYLTMVETGMLMGESVPMGKIGRFYRKIREAQKSRTVKHPATGEELRIEAKPAKGVPKISFSNYLKDRLAAIDGECL